VGRYFLSLGCTRESRCTLLCSPRVALKLLVYEHAQNTVLHLYGTSKSHEMLKCGRRNFFCPWSYGCLGPYCWRLQEGAGIGYWLSRLSQGGSRLECPACYMCLKGGDSCLHKGDCGVEITCLYMITLAAPVTNRRLIGSVIGLDLVGKVEIHVPA
jgi:hypothetical protein